MKYVTLENMLGINDNDKEFIIEVPDSSEEIIKAAQEVYNYILKYFENGNNSNKFAKVLDRIKDLSYENIKEYGPDIIEKYDGETLLAEYKNFVNEDKIKSALENNSSDESNILFSIFYSILFFSCFEFNKGKNNVYDNNCYLYEKELTKFDGYKFKKDDNTLFDFVSKLGGWTANYYYYTNKLTGLSDTRQYFKDLLTDGIYDNCEVFKEENEIKGFINSCISDDSGEYTISVMNVPIEYYEFRLLYNITENKNIYRLFIQRIHYVLNSKAGKSQSSAANSAENIENVERELTSYSKITAVSVRADILDNYIKLFKYSVELLKKYVNILKNDETLNSKDVKKILYDNDGWAALLMNTIVGISSNGSDTYSFDSSFIKKSIYEFDSYYGNGSSIIDEIIKYSGVSLSDNTVGEIGNTNIDFGLTASKLEKSKGTKFAWTVKKSEVESEKKKIEKIIKKLNEDTNVDSFFFYELKYFSNIFDGKYSLENENKSELEARINDILKISSNIIYKICIFCFYDIEKTNDYKINLPPTRTNYEYDQIYCDSRTYKLKRTITIRDVKPVRYNGVAYGIDDKEFEKLYKALGTDIANYLNNIIKIEVESAGNVEKKKQVKQNYKKFEEYILSRLKSGYYTEKDYFYINDNGVKRMPVNSFVDVEFRVPIYNSKTGSYESEWIPVTAVRTSDTDNDIVFNKQTDIDDGNQDDKELEMHAGTYFDSMELNDNGGIKEISLSLKSSNDMNLERIIYNSLSLESKLNIYNGKGINSDQNIIADVEKIIKDNASSNFRVRFGYRDIASNDSSNNETTITSSNVSDNDFINRAKIFEQERNKYVKPVMVYPWTYFKITGLESNIKDGEDTYNITGVSSGAYILDNMSLCGIPSNFSANINLESSSTNDFTGTPRNVIGKLVKWIMMASADEKNDMSGNKDLSSARICFLGDEKGTIINDIEGVVNEEKFKTNYRYILKGNGTFIDEITGEIKSDYLKGGDIQSIEEYFFNGSSNRNILRAKNFNIQNDKKSISVKNILDELIKWLPARVYYIAHSEKYDSVVAVHLPYESIYTMPDFFQICPHKTERMTYQIIEADAHIYKEGERFTDSQITDENFYHKVYFIRMYYEGPGRSTDENGNEEVTNDYLRIYNYRSLQEQVIENIDISCENEFGNTVSSVSLLGSGTPMTFVYNMDGGVINEDAIASNTKNIVDGDIKSHNNSSESFNYIFDPKSSQDLKPFFTLNNSQYIITDTKGIKNTPSTLSTYTLTASHFFSDMQNKLYSGEMTILGDPFYYFDSSVEAGKYEIYLQMNRAENQKTYKMVPSRYTGIYYIKGIKHNIDSSGKYTTTLSIFKRIFTGND